MSAQRSIVICGGAFAGLALAVALRQGLGADIAGDRRRSRAGDPAQAAIRAPPRSSPLAAGCSRRLVYGRRSPPTAQPILDMVVTDSKLEDATRPVFLTFAGDVEPGEPFAHMVENRHLIDALVARAEAEGVDLRATAVTSFEFAQRGRRRDAGGRQPHRGEPSGRGRRRALETARTRRHRHPWLGLRSVRHRRHRRPRARSSGPRRRTFPCPPGRSRSCR